MDTTMILSVIAFLVVIMLAEADAWATRRENKKLRHEIVSLATAIAPIHEIRQGNLEAARLMMAATREAHRVEDPSAGAPEQPKQKTGIVITQS